MAAPVGRTPSVGEFLDELAAALQWPLSRPARLLLGDRASRVSEVALCVDDASIDSIEADTGILALLMTPATQRLARRGRRSYDVFEGTSAETWQRAHRVILDGSEILAGGVGGVDELLAADAGMKDAQPLVPLDRDELKFVAFVPEDALEQVREAVFRAGAGGIGDYTECSWSTSGTGTFRGGAETDPTIGEAGEFQQVRELRFETLCPTHRRLDVARAFVSAHPYEEPAYDFVRLATPSEAGAARVGTIAGRRAVVTSGELGPILARLLQEQPGSVVCAGASDFERALLAERDVELQLLDRATVVRSHGERIAAVLSRRLGMKVQLLGPPLVFPSQDAAPVTAAPPDVAPASARHAGAAPAAAGTWKLYFDGGSRGNPGPAAAAFVLYEPDGLEAARWHQALGRATNNVAEYTGVLHGLRRARELEVDDLHVYGDSELIVKQLRGEYRVKNAQLQPLHAQAAALLKGFRRVRIDHVYRTDNAVADALVNEALDAASSR